MATSVLQLPDLGRWWFLVIAVLAGFALVVWLNRHHIYVTARSPVVLTKGHISLFGALVGFAVAMAIVTSAINRHQVLKEREARVEADIKSLSDRISLNKANLLTASEVRRIAQQVNQPTQKDFVRFLERFNAQCSMSPRCKQLYTESVTKVLRVTPSGQIVPAPPGNPPARRRPRPARPAPAPRPAAPPPKVIVRPDPRVDDLRRQVLDLRRAITDLQSRKQDSSVTNGLDNRLADVEGSVQKIVGRVDALQGLLSSLCRILTPTKPC